MKLLFAIIQDEDEKMLTKTLVEQDFNVTRISSSGGFLRSGNATLMIGVDKERLDTALSIIRAQSHRRKAMTAAAPLTSRGAEGAPMPMQVSVGGATVFLIDVEQFYKF